MINEPDRIPPADPWRIRLAYRLDQRWWFDADQEPETWQISADIHDDSGTHLESHVGDISIVTVDIYDASDPFGLLDGEDADLGLIAEAIFDPATGCLHPELDQRLQPLGSRILILSSARLTPTWRGFGLGALLAGTAIRKLSAGARAAVCYPAPLDDATPDEDADSPEDPARRQAVVATLSEVWERLGFEHFRDGVHVLDLNLVTLNESLQRLAKDAERHRTYD
jgi:hypothetical protein